MRTKTIKTGMDDDVLVEISEAHGVAVIDCPNNYDVNWVLVKRDEHSGEPYAIKSPHNDPSRVYFAVPLDRLGNDKAIDVLHEKIKLTRQFSKEVANEKEKLEMNCAFDHTETGKKAVVRFARPDRNFAGGEVVHADHYYIVLKQGATEDKQYFQAIQTHKVLQGKEFSDRKASLETKMKVGDMKLLSFTNTGKVEVAPYVPRPKAQEQLDITQEQKNALMAFREANGPKWKEALSDNWHVSNYPSVSKQHVPALQQLRNQKGPQWLMNLKSESLYLGKAAEPVEPIAEPQIEAPKEETPKAEPKVEKKAVKKTAVKKVKKEASIQL